MNRKLRFHDSQPANPESSRILFKPKLAALSFNIGVTLQILFQSTGCNPCCGELWSDGESGISYEPVGVLKVREKGIGRPLNGNCNSHGSQSAVTSLKFVVALKSYLCWT